MPLHARPVQCDVLAAAACDLIHDIRGPCASDTGWADRVERQGKQGRMQLRQRFLERRLLRISPAREIPMRYPIIQLQVGKPPGVEGSAAPVMARCPVKASQV